MRSVLAATTLVLLSLSCTAPRVREPEPPPKPSETYAEALIKSGLAEKEIGKRWFAAARRAVEEPVPVALPYREIMAFHDSEPDARGYRVELTRGQRLSIELAASGGAGVAFVDLFAPALNENNPPVHLLSAEAPAPLSQSATVTAAGFRIEYEARWNGTFLLRLQPELLAGGRFLLTVERGPSLSFPVEGGGGGSVKSFFGDPRDGGRRSHQGVDIFAARGTPVLAVSDGWVMSTRPDRLGGKVVWQADPSRRLAIYYAHLDEQLVRRGQRIAKGQPLGLVGNTGNAIHTPPHLHFGIYDGGALDPLPYIDDRRPVAPDPKIDLGLLGRWLRVRPAKAKLLESPARRALVRRDLERHDAVRAIGAFERWIHVELPDGERGFVSAAILEAPLPPRITSSARRSL